MSSDNVQAASLSREDFVQAARRFEKASKQLVPLVHEIGELSKKKPDGPINKFKLGFINKLLEEVSPLLGDMKPFADFTLFDADIVPTNSDVKLILSQYVASCRAKRERDARKDGDFGMVFWYLEDDPIVEADSRDDRFYEDRYLDALAAEEDEEENGDDPDDDDDPDQEDDTLE